MHGNAYKQRAERTFGGVENFGGAILGAQKFGFRGRCVLYLCSSEVRLHLSLSR